MSLLNAWIAPDAAIVVTDSIGMAADGSPLHASKLVVVPHLGAVVGLRGQLSMLVFLYLRANSASFATCDDLLVAMPGMLSEAEAAIGDHLNVLGGSAPGYEVLVVGWSDRQGRMVGRQFIRRDDMPDTSIVRDVDRHISPWHPSLEGLPTEPHGLEQLARGQVIFMRGLGAHCGGKLTVARLIRGELTLQTTKEI